MFQHFLTTSASARVGSTVVVSARKRSTRSRTKANVVAASARRDAVGAAADVDRRAFIATSLAAAFTNAGAAPARAGGNDDADANFASKLSAKEARKSQILAEARAKAAAQASSTGGTPDASAPKNADFVVTGDPGRGGGPDAPNTAQ